MHKRNIEILRKEAQRQLQLLKALLQKSQKNGLINNPAEKASERTTFDTESLPKVINILDGEHYKLENLEMVLAVVGTMKAGKSTSINAIVGAEVLPNRNRPMTALPTLIRHTPGILVPRLKFEKIQPLNDLLKSLYPAVRQACADIRKELENDADMRQLLEQIEQGKPFATQHVGEEAIFEFLKGLNDLVRLCFKLNSGDKKTDFPFDAYSSVDAMPVIEVEFSHLKGMQATQGRLTLLDTPGPNEDGQQHLRKMLQEQLKKASAVLAVLDYTQLKSDADAKVRKNLLEVADTAKDRMYALVNKFDQKDRNSDDESTVKKYVSKTLMGSVITEDGVFPVSSKYGYLASRARNEIERHGKLNLKESWVKDFAEDAFGRRWEKYVEDPKEVKEGADDLWKQSGFIQPLEKVIFQAHQNAAFEALRSATSKILDNVEKAKNFFNANVGALAKDTQSLQKNIDNLQQDISNLNQVVAETESKLKQAMDGMKKNIRTEAEKVQQKILGTARDYLQKGKSIEAALAEQAKKLEKEESARGVNQTLSKFREDFKKIVHGEKSTKNAPPTSNHSIKGATENNIIKFDKKEEANGFRKNIENSIRSLFNTAEHDFQYCIEQGISAFNRDLDEQRQDTVERIRKSAQENLKGFDIEIKLPKSQPISLDTSVASILKDAVEEKYKEETRSRRKSGVWGTVCRWFGTDDWGWEDYTVKQDYYEVNLNRIFNSSNEGLKKLFSSAQNALDKEVYPQLHAGVDDFFKEFREKIEHIRGDLISGVEKHRLDEDEKKRILDISSQMAREANDLEKDCKALHESAESLFKK